MYIILFYRNYKNGYKISFNMQFFKYPVGFILGPATYILFLFEEPLWFEHDKQIYPFYIWIKITQNIWGSS